MATWEDLSQFRFSHVPLPAGRLVKGVALSHPGTLFQNKNLDWFPRMRAMSLVSGEGEGEQNEIRILQEKLGSTMKLVSHLTSQLNELKEQVCSQSQCPKLPYHVGWEPSKSQGTLVQVEACAAARKGLQGLWWWESPLHVAAATQSSSLAPCCGLPTAPDQGLTC